MPCANRLSGGESYWSRSQQQFIWFIGPHSQYLNISASSLPSADTAGERDGGIGAKDHVQDVIRHCHLHIHPVYTAQPSWFPWQAQTDQNLQPSREGAHWYRQTGDDSVTVSSWTKVQRQCNRACVCVCMCVCVCVFQYFPPLYFLYQHAVCYLAQLKTRACPYYLFFCTTVWVWASERECPVNLKKKICTRAQTR